MNRWYLVNVDIVIMLLLPDVVCMRAVLRGVFYRHSKSTSSKS